MKLFVFCGCILAFSSFSLAKTVKDRLKSAATTEDVVETCVIENDITFEDFYSETELINGVYSEPGNEERKKKNGCTIECVLKRAEVLVDSEIKENKLHEYINEKVSDPSLAEEAAQLHKFARDCTKEVRNVSNQDCEKSLALMACYARAEHKEHGEHEHEEHGEHEHKEHGEHEQE